jgi:thiol-disulfide isomerase/thioredoxin
MDHASGDHDPERWTELHEELTVLPESFRTPLVLCYLEGLTQEQAASQLRCPLGTIQSRLARGRAKLKARLLRRGITPAAGFLGAETMAPEQAARASWVEETARAAVAFSNHGAPALVSAAGSPAAALAAECLRAMGLARLKIALVGGLVAVIATLGAASVATVASGRGEGPSTARAIAEAQAVPPATLRPTAPVAGPDRTVRGIVRDDKGRPLAKAWVGSDPRPMQDDWDNPRPEDIRERKAPFRDAKGDIVPPGAVGKYFEVRDSRGQWRPVSPDDIRRFEPTIWDGNGHALSREEVAKRHSPYSVRVARGGWWMAAPPGVQNAVRTDAVGRFATIFPLPSGSGVKLHFASADYTLQAIRTLKPEEIERPLEVTLAPTRLVRARVIEVPDDDPKAYLNGSAYTVDPAGKILAEWQSWMLPNPNAHDPDHVKRHLDVRLPTGRYKVEFSSETVRRLLDIDVPPGDGPLDLPDLLLERRASVRMVGKPAAEIEATDLAGKPVRLADYRGKVVVLDFWATWCGPCIGAMPRLMEFQRRFKDHPLVILALHDASVASFREYRKAVTDLPQKIWGTKDLPFPVLLDRSPQRKETGANSQGPGDRGTGRTAERYEIDSWPSTFLIDRDGKLVGKFELDALEGALEDQFGQPRSRPDMKVAAGRAEPPPEHRDVKVRGKVVGLDGKPVVGAKLSPQTVVVRQHNIATGPDGNFEFTAERILIDHFELKVEAPGLASSIFTIPATGEVGSPLKLGTGAVVTGRVIRDGKPVPGVPLAIYQMENGMGKYLGHLETTTDAEGRFRFSHAFTGQEFHLYAKTGSLADHGAITPRAFRTAGDGTAIELGVLEVRPGRKLAGRVVFADGKAIPAGTKVLASPENIAGLVYAKVDPSGHFEVLGLPDSEISIAVQLPRIQTWMPPGYRLSKRNKCLDPLNTFHLVGRLDHDVSDLIILYEPGEAPWSSLDPGLLADFEETRKGMIAGASARDIAPR